MAAEDRRLLENGNPVRPVQQMRGHEAGAATTDDGDIQVVTLQRLIFAYGLRGLFKTRLIEATMARQLINPGAGPSGNTDSSLALRRRAHED